MLVRDIPSFYTIIRQWCSEYQKVQAGSGITSVEVICMLTLKSLCLFGSLDFLKIKNVIRVVSDNFACEVHGETLYLAEKSILMLSELV